MRFGETMRHDQCESENQFAHARTGTLLFRSARVEIRRGGITPADRSRWGTEQNHASLPCVSFPMVPVLVEKEGMSPFIGAMNRASLFNQGQKFRVTSVGPTTTSSFRLYFSADLIAEAFNGRSGWTGDGARPFALSSTIIGHEIFIEHRKLQARMSMSTDAMQIEEHAVRILGMIAARLDTPTAPLSEDPRTRLAHEDAVRATERIISTRYGERLTLPTIARSACVAPTHLCRIYRSCTGITVHEYLNRYRLRRAVDLLLTTRMDTSEIAARCGFSSRAHFSDSLVRATGARPGTIRSLPDAIRTNMDARSGDFA